MTNVKRYWLVVLALTLMLSALALASSAAPVDAADFTGTNIESCSFNTNGGPGKMIAGDAIRIRCNTDDMSWADSLTTLADWNSAIDLFWQTPNASLHNNGHPSGCSSSSARNCANLESFAKGDGWYELVAVVTFANSFGFGQYSFNWCDPDRNYFCNSDLTTKNGAHTWVRVRSLQVETDGSRMSTDWDALPPHTVNGEGLTEVVPACLDVSYGIRVNGTDYLMGLAGVSPAPIMGPGDDVILVVEYPTDGPLSPASFRWRQSPARSFAPGLFIDAASVGGASLVSYRLTPTFVSDVADAELRCNSSEGDSYRRFGDSEWSGVPLVNRACSSLRMSMPEGDGSILQVVDIVASSSLPSGDYAGGDTGVNVELRGWDHAGVESRTRFGALVGGVAPFVFDIPVGHDGTTTFVDVNIDEPMLGWSYFSVRCFDSLGSLILDGTGDVYVYDPDSGTWSEADGFGDCLSGSGIGLNPASWVPAVGSMGVCIIRVSVVPSAAAMESRLERFEALRDQPPIQWADEGVTYVTGTDIEFADWATAGPECFDVMDTAVCPRTWASGVTVPGWVVGVLLFGLWSSLVFAVWRWL